MSKLADDWCYSVWQLALITLLDYDVNKEPAVSNNELEQSIPKYTMWEMTKLFFVG